jgi:hypothetical protein
MQQLSIVHTRRQQVVKEHKRLSRELYVSGNKKVNGGCISGLGEMVFVIQCDIRCNEEDVMRRV